MVGLVVIALVVLVLLGVVLMMWLNRVSAHTRERHEALSESPTTLRYAVPEGQDPAVVIAALERAGYTAVRGPAPSMDDDGDVLIDSPHGTPDREKVREVIAGVDTMNLGSAHPAPQGERTPRFIDE